jgi:hypothetical protein
VVFLLLGRGMVFSFQRCEGRFLVVQVPLPGVVAVGAGASFAQGGEFAGVGVQDPQSAGAVPAAAAT